MAMAPGTSIIGAGHEYHRREQFGQRHDGGGPDEVVGRTRTDGRDPRELFERQRDGKVRIWKVQLKQLEDSKPCLLHI